MKVRPVSAETLPDLPMYQQITASDPNQTLRTAEQSIPQDNSWTNFKKTIN
ncbi:hypothetical protein SNF32_09995 [Enterococcus mundtii]|nr:hypothetical protein [Enterococcus mundtii]